MTRREVRISYEQHGGGLTSCSFCGSLVPYMKTATHTMFHESLVDALMATMAELERGDIRDIPDAHE